MDEMNELERQLAGVVRGAMRPPRPVDAAAIVRSATSDAGSSRWPLLTRLRRQITHAPRARSGSGGDKVTGGINMLVSVRTAAIVATLALTTSLLALQVGGPSEPLTPGAIEGGGSWVTITGTQEILSTSGGYGAATNTMSDERLSGDVAITWKAAGETGADEDNDALWGTVTIANEGGTWQGQWVGFVDDQGRHHITSWFDGTGAYDGLRYIEQGTQREQDGLLDSTGLIYEGVAPSTVIPAAMVE